MVNNWISALLNLIFPPVCILCRCSLSNKEDVYICDSCRQKLQGELVWCSRCGGVHYPPAACFTRSKYIKGFIALGSYEGKIQDAVKMLKYRGARRMAVPLAELLWERWQLSGWADPAAVIPVPLHSRRMRMRGYNQAYLLARELARLSGVPVTDVMRRVKDTKSQTGLNAYQRKQNMKDAFSVQNTNLPAGAVLLVDDVLTTGATLEQAAEALAREGHKEIYACVVAQSGKFYKS